MEQRDLPINCQLPCLPHFFEGYAEVPPESLARRIRLFVRRSLNARQIRFIKTGSVRLITRAQSLLRQESISPEDASTKPESIIQAGDLVRVRSMEEIQATLNVWGISKGCMFMPGEMSPYCGTAQRVFKRMSRFVDERDYHVKKCNGIILLEGLHCQGTTDFGQCDRSCFFFWREEWLEKIDETGYKEK
jgi:hypothetical protein